MVRMVWWLVLGLQIVWKILRSDMSRQFIRETKELVAVISHALEDGHLTKVEIKHILKESIDVGEALAAMTLEVNLRDPINRN